MRTSYFFFFYSYGTNARFRHCLRDAIVYLGNWLKTEQTEVKHEVTHALFTLSDNEDNCILMYNCGVVEVNIIFCFIGHLVNTTHYGPFGATPDIGGAHCIPLLVMHIPVVLFN